MQCSSDSESDFCIYPEQVCDGIANCIHGEDEDFKRCNREEYNVFSPMATIRCLKKNVYFNITIKAVMCDNISECANGEDEEGCFLDDYVSTTFLLSLIPICSFVTLLMWNLTVRHLNPVNPDPIDLKSLGRKHLTEELETYMYQIQHTRYSKSINQAFIRMELTLHNGLSSETICCIKVSWSCHLFSTYCVNFLVPESSGFFNSGKDYEGFTIRKRRFNNQNNSKHTQLYSFQDS